MDAKVVSQFGKCSSCGSDNERDFGYIVCTGCGHTDKDCLELTEDPIQSIMRCDNQLLSQQSVSSSMRNSLIAESKTTSVRRSALRFAETLAVNYSFTSDMKKYMKTYFLKAIDNKKFFRTSLKNKQILGAVVVYITLLQNNESIAIQYICSSVDCSGYDFDHKYKEFLNEFPECKPQTKAIEVLVPSVLKDFCFEGQEQNKMVERVIDIICIEKGCWLVSGRSPIHLILASAFIAWKSLDATDRSRVKLTQFTKMFPNIQYTNTTIDRIKELNDLFIKLAKLIPIVKLKNIFIHKNNVCLFVDDIIQYSNSLIYDLKCDVYLKTWHLDEEDDTQWMNSFKRKVYYDSNGHKKAKTCQPEEEEIEDQDISDTEIDGYIRSDLEIKRLKKLWKRAKKLDQMNENMD